MNHQNGQAKRRPQAPRKQTGDPSSTPRRWRTRIKFAPSWPVRVELKAGRFRGLSVFSLWVTQRDIDLSGDHETKTKKALAFFSKNCRSKQMKNPRQNDQSNDSVASNRVSQ